MIVCHCKGITERTIRKAVRDGARCRNEIARACAAGSHCGGCTPVIDEIVECESSRQRSGSFSALIEIAATS